MFNLSPTQRVEIDSYQVAIRLEAIAIVSNIRSSLLMMTNIFQATLLGHLDWQDYTVQRSFLENLLKAMLRCRQNVPDKSKSALSLATAYLCMWYRALRYNEQISHIVLAFCSCFCQLAFLVPDHIDALCVCFRREPAGHVHFDQHAEDPEGVPFVNVCSNAPVSFYVTTNRLFQ